VGATAWVSQSDPTPPDVGGSAAAEYPSFHPKARSTTRPPERTPGTHDEPDMSHTAPESTRSSSSGPERIRRVPARGRQPFEATVTAPSSRIPRFLEDADTALELQIGPNGPNGTTTSGRRLRDLAHDVLNASSFWPVSPRTDPSGAMRLHSLWARKVNTIRFGTPWSKQAEMLRCPG
jgi:hypothetical protein